MVFIKYVSTINSASLFLASSSVNPDLDSLGLLSAPCIASVLNKAIRNSFLNSQNQSEFKPITTDELLEDVKEVFKDAKQGETKSELLTKIKTKNFREMINEKEIGILKKISPENIKKYSSEIKIGKQEIDGVTQETRTIITQENTKANELTSK